MSMTFAMAQTNEGKEDAKQFAPFDRTEMMTSKLGLSKKQANKVKELNEKYKDVLEAHGPMHPFGFGPQGLGPQMMGPAPQGMKEHKELSAEEKAKFEAKMKEMQARRKEYKQKLKELKEQYKYVVDFHGPKFGHKVRKNKGANCNCCRGNGPQGNMPFPQLNEEDKAKFEAKMKEDQTKRQEYDAKLKEILSDSQYAEYQKMQPKHPGKKHRNHPSENHDN